MKAYSIFAGLFDKATSEIENAISRWESISFAANSQTAKEELDMILRRKK